MWLDECGFSIRQPLFHILATRRRFPPSRKRLTAWVYPCLARRRHAVTGFCSVGTKLVRSRREVLTQENNEEKDDYDSTEADIHINLHRVADPLRGYLSARQ